MSGLNVVTAPFILIHLDVRPSKSKRFHQFRRRDLFGGVSDRVLAPSGRINSYEATPDVLMFFL